MNVERLILDFAKSLAAKGGKVYVKPDIPEKKLNGALTAIAPQLNPDYVLVVVDTSLLGNVKTGFVFTGDTVYIRNAGLIRNFKYADLKACEKEESVESHDGKDVVLSRYLISTTDTEKLNITEGLEGIQKDAFLELLQQILASNQDTDEPSYEVTKQVLALVVHPAEVREAYIKLMCNYCYLNDNTIDASEYTEIMSMIVKNELSFESRLRIQSYMLDSSQMEKSQELIDFLMENTDPGSVEAMKLSILMECMNLHYSRRGSVDWSQNEIVTELKNYFVISDEVADLLMEVVAADKRILNERRTDFEIKEYLTKIFEKAKEQGIPLASFYFSGASQGVSAAQMMTFITSLGIRENIGFSGSYVQFGVAKLVGDALLKKGPKLNGKGEVEQYDKRVMLLSDMVLNYKRILSYLVEDMKGKSDQQISFLMIVARQVIERINEKEKEMILCHLPQRLQVGLLEKLIPEATKQNIRSYIESAYSKTIVKNAKSYDHYLDESLPYETLRNVMEALQGVGYYSAADSSFASVKGAARNFVKGILG